MITKGTILALPNSKTENKFLVEIDIFKTAGLPEDSNLNASKQKATLCYPAGIVNNYKVGDVVIVGFENNQMSSPIILGKFYSTIDIKGNVIDRENTGVGLFQSLQVSGDTTLPLTTTFKNATDEISANDILVHIRQIANLENKVDNKQDLLISGVNIKTINNQSLLGSGNIDIGGGGGSGNVSTNDTLTADKLILGSGTTYIKKSTLSISDIALTADLPVVTFNESTISGGTTIYGMTVDGDDYNFPTKTSQLINDSSFAKTDANNYFTQDQTIVGSTSTDTAPLTIKSGANTAYIQYKNSNNNVLGYLGVSSTSKPIFWDTSAHFIAYDTDVKSALSNNYSVAYNLVVNSNGYQYSGYKFADVTISGLSYTIKQFQVSTTSAVVTDTSIIKDYLKVMTGRDRIPEYDEDCPTNEFIVCSSNNTIWKLQYDSTNGLLAFKVENMPSVFPANEVSYLTTAPSANNTSGRLKFVVLSSEPATYYDGYYYIITGSN